MKKVAGTIIAIALVFFVLWNYSIPKTIDKSAAGYDLYHLGYNKATIKIYHSNTPTSHWGLLETLKVDLNQEIPSFDIRVTAEVNKVKISLQHITSETKNGMTNYYSKNLEQFSMTVEDFDGGLKDLYVQPLKTVSNEQAHLIYPIVNDGQEAIFMPSFELDKKYDENKINLDNILITVTLQK